MDGNKLKAACGFVLKLIVPICFCVLVAIGHAQTTETDSVVSVVADEAGLQPVSPDTLPMNGTFWIVMPGNGGGSVLPYPCPLFDPNLPVYQITDGTFLVDDTTNGSGMNAASLLAQADIVSNLITQVQQSAQQQGSATMFGMSDGMFGDSDDFDVGGSNTLYGNGLWLQITNIANDVSYVNLYNATDQVYAIWSTTNLTAGWNVETELWPAGDQTNVMPFTVQNNGRQTLFLMAEDWTGVTENGNTTPNWWFWEYFGTTDLSDTNLDSTGGNTLLEDYEAVRDPNIIQFSLQFTNSSLNTTTAYGTATILEGWPSSFAVLVNNTNETSAVWQPYTSTNVVVPVGSSNGVYNVLVGLRGLPANAKQTWMGTQLTFDDVAPTITVTNPAPGTVSVPTIQLQGLVNQSLSTLTYDVSNSTGIFTNQQGYWLPTFYNTSLLAFTTNSFQCCDIGLAAGLNVITLHATDVAGNSSATNVSYTLNYSGDHTPPVLSLEWPVGGITVCSSNFTLQAQVDDSTATVTASIGGGTFQGLVQRDGTVWINNLPLNGATNTVTVTATDAAGNVSTTNFVVIQGAGLIVNPISTSQLNEQMVTVTGAIDNSSDHVIVNGVSASVTNYTWTATNVPVSPTVLATLNVRVTDSGNNPLGTLTVNQPQPAAAELMSYTGTQFFHFGDTGSSFNDSIDWTYKSGGNIKNSNGGNLPITSLTNGIAYVGSGTSRQLTVPWEYASLTVPLYYGPYTDTYQTHIQTRVMIDAEGQATTGTAKFYLVQAVANEFSYEVMLDGYINDDDVEYARYFNTLVGSPFDEGAVYINGDWSEYYGGDWPLPPEWLQIKGQTLINTGTTNDQGAVIGETIVSAPAGVNVDVTPTATQVHQNQDYTFYVEANEVKLKIFDAISEQDLTLQTNTVVVGQQMNLTCQLSINDTNFPATNFQWTVPGLAISNYAVAEDESSAVVVTNFATTSTNTSFYWLDGATNRIVQCSAVVNGKTIVAQATFNVIRPTVDFNGVITGSVALNTNYAYLAPGTLALHFGGSVTAGVTNQGITCTDNNINLNGYTTNASVGFVAVQVLTNRIISITYNDGSQQVYTTNGLDNDYPTGSLGDGDGGVFFDSPASGAFPTNWVQYSRTDHFITVLMFETDEQNPIPIPMKEIDWTWSGSILFTNNNWILTSTNSAITSNDASTYSFPTWSSKLVNNN